MAYLLCHRKQVMILYTLQRHRKGGEDTILPLWLKRWSMMRNLCRHQLPTIEEFYNIHPRLHEPAQPFQYLNFTVQTRLRPMLMKNTPTQMALLVHSCGTQLILQDTAL